VDCDCSRNASNPKTRLLPSTGINDDDDDKGFVEMGVGAFVFVGILLLLLLLLLVVVVLAMPLLIGKKKRAPSNMEGFAVVCAVVDAAQ